MAVPVQPGLSTSAFRGCVTANQSSKQGTGRKVSKLAKSDPIFLEVLKLKKQKFHEQKCCEISYFMASHLDFYFPISVLETNHHLEYACT